MSEQSYTVFDLPIVDGQRVVAFEIPSDHFEAARERHPGLGMDLERLADTGFLMVGEKDGAVAYAVDNEGIAELISGGSVEDETAFYSLIGSAIRGARVREVMSPTSQVINPTLFTAPNGVGDFSFQTDIVMLDQPDDVLEDRLIQVTNEIARSIGYHDFFELDGNALVDAKVSKETPAGISMKLSVNSRVGSDSDNADREQEAGVYTLSGNNVLSFNGQPLIYLAGAIALTLPKIQPLDA